MPSDTSLELSQALTNLRTVEQPGELTDEVADSSSITSESTLFTDSGVSGELSLGPERDFAELHSPIHSIVYAQGSSNAPRLYDSLKGILQGVRVVFHESRPVVDQYVVVVALAISTFNEQTFIHTL